MAISGARRAGARAETSWAGLALLGYLLLVAAVITLSPFRFARPGRVRVEWIVDPGDVIANVLLFLPLGFLARLSGLRGPRVAAATGIALSAGLEALQTFLPGRYPSPVDVVANGAGAWLGALLHRRLEHPLSARVVTGLALELPLMNLVYLLVPLLWLDGLAAGRDRARLWLLPILALFGGSILAAIWRHRLAPAQILSPGGIAGVAAAWLAVAAFPALTLSPGFVMGCAGVLAGVVRLQARPAAGDATDRRFELPTMRRLWPVYAAYLILAALWPWPWAPGPWRGAIGLIELADLPGVIPMLRLLEYLASFTLLGYMLAEARGRRDESASRLGVHVATASVAIAALLEALRGVHPAHGASLLHLALAAGMGLYGGLLYRLQLGVVRRLLGADR